MRLEVEVDGKWIDCFHADEESDEVFTAAEEFHRKLGERTRRVE